MWAAAWPKRNEVVGIHVNSLTSLLCRPRQRKESLKMKRSERSVHKSGSLCAHRSPLLSALGGMNNKTLFKAAHPVSARQCCHNSRPLHHIVSSRLSPAWVIFHGCGNANTNIKAFLCARKCLTLGAFSDFGPVSVCFSFSQLLVIPCNCWVWWELGRRGASPSQCSCRDESNELSSARLPERCAFPRLHWAGEGRVAQTEPARFYGEKWSRREIKKKKREEVEGGRENEWAGKNSIRAATCLPKYVRPSYAPSLALTQLLLRREDWVEVVVEGGGESWINTACL